VLECRVKSLGDGVQIADEQVSGSAGWLSPPLNCLYAKQLVQTIATQRRSLTGVDFLHGIN